MKIDKKIIKELTDYLEEFNLTELEYSEKDTKVKVSRKNYPLNNKSTITNEKLFSDINKAEENIESGIKIISPIIGTAYHAPEPGAKKSVSYTHLTLPTKA